MKIDSSYTDIENFQFEPLAAVKAKLSELNALVAKQSLFIVVTKKTALFFRWYVFIYLFCFSLNWHRFGNYTLKQVKIQKAKVKSTNKN